MEYNKKSRVSNIMNNAKQTKDELISNLENKIAELEKMLVEIEDGSNPTINNYMKMAKEYDVNYVPDKQITKTISYFIENLNMIKEKLNIELTEKNVFEEEEYWQKAEKALELINEKLKEEKEKFKKSNEDRFNTADEKKIQTKIELSNLDIDLTRLESTMEDLIEEKNELQKKMDRIKLEFLNRKNKSRMTIISNEILKTRTEIKKINKRITELKIINDANHFNPNFDDKGQKSSNLLENNTIKSQEEVK